MNITFIGLPIKEKVIGGYKIHSRMRSILKAIGCVHILVRRYMYVIVI